jgi:Rrf2 family protein
MFRVTRAEEQALRLAMRMATLARQVTLSELALAEDLPEPTVAKLLGMLRRGGVLDAVRGRNGGYALAREASAICAAEILAAVSRDEMFAFTCQDAAVPPDCSRPTDCALRSVWQYLEGRVAGVLRQTSLADLLAREAAAGDSLQDIWPRAGS